MFETKSPLLFLQTGHGHFAQVSFEERGARVHLLTVPEMRANQKQQHGRCERKNVRNSSCGVQRKSIFALVSIFIRLPPTRRTCHKRDSISVYTGALLYGHKTKKGRGVPLRAFVCCDYIFHWSPLVTVAREGAWE